MDDERAALLDTRKELLTDIGLLKVERYIAMLDRPPEALLAIETRIAALEEEVRMVSRAALLKQIAALKEERNLAVLANAPEDDVAAGQDHPDVRAIEDHIAELRAQVAALPEEEE